MTSIASMDLGGLFRSFVPMPDPCPAEERAKQAKTKTQVRYALLQDRACPEKLAKIVSGVVDHTVENTKALQVALVWHSMTPGERGREVLVLAGQRGRGKSYAAAQVLALHKFGRWENARWVANMLHDREDGPRSLKRLITAPFAVIDDLGWEYMDKGGFALSAFVGLIDDRIQAERRTIITVNMNEETFVKRYGDAIHDRVRGYGIWCNVPDGPSMR